MTIRPVDMQTLIPRASEVSRVQHARDIQPAVEKQQAQMQIRHLADQSQRQVSQTETTPEKSRINPDDSSKERQQRKRERAKKSDSKESTEPGKGTRLDVRV